MTLEQLVGDAVALAESVDARPASADERNRFVELIAAARVGDRGAATATAGEIAYEILDVVDDGVEAPVVAVRPGPAGRSLGVLVHRPGGAPIVVEVPHPVFDVDSALLALDVHRRLGASDLLIAGTHREAAPAGVADVAHAASSPFEDAHRLLLADMQAVVQLHGFAEENHPGLDAAVVVSAGAAGPGELDARVTAHLRAAGFEACRFGDRGCDVLGGRTNVQSRSARARGVPFLHVEVARRLREAPARGELAAALAGGVARALAG